METADASQFIEQINRQEPQAYRELYRRFYRSLVLYALRFVGQQDVAEDLVQELFVAMWNKRMSFFSYLSFRTYLYNAVHNAALNHLKHLDIEQRYAEQMSQSGESWQDASEACEEEIYRQLYQAIDELAPKCREIFLMCMDGKRNEEIAETLQLAVETVKTQKKRALKFLRKRAVPALSALLAAHPGLFE